VFQFAFAVAEEKLLSMRPNRAEGDTDNDDESYQPASCDIVLSKPLGYRNLESKSII